MLKSMSSQLKKFFIIKRNGWSSFEDEKELYITLKSGIMKGKYQAFPI